MMSDSNAPYLLAVVADAYTDHRAPAGSAWVKLQWRGTLFETTVLLDGVGHGSAKKMLGVTPRRLSRMYTRLCRFLPLANGAGQISDEKTLLLIRHLYQYSSTACLPPLVLFRVAAGNNTAEFKPAGIDDYIRYFTHLRLPIKKPQPRPV